jgi:lysophospholipase L1-like esterase
MQVRNIFLRVCLALAAVAFALLLLEVGVRGYDSFTNRSSATRPEAPAVPLHIVTDDPFLYTLNPNHPDISAQGTRDDAVAIPKPNGTLRILVLGDSLAYGSDVTRDKTFPNRLENLLRQEFGPSVEVVNSGVAGYTPYNELEYYLAKGRKFDADIVILAFCMNDVVDPRLHWGDAPGVKIPYEAIPNHEYDERVILPRMQNLKEQPAEPAGTRAWLSRHSQLYSLIEKRLLKPKRKFYADTGAAIPTYITGEDTISIEVLLDRNTPEWKWLASIYDRLNDAVQADRAKLLIAIFPLAYQLDANYPFLPQRQIVDYCNEKRIRCLDLLPPFRRYSQADIFMLDRAEYHDVWHLTESGHALAAQELLTFLRSGGMLSGSSGQR